MGRPEGEPMLALALLACSPEPLESGDIVGLWKSFPFDGERTWEFLSTDTTLPYALYVTSSDKPEVVDGSNVYPVTAETDCRAAGDCEDEILWSIRWSSDTTSGVRIHGWTVGDEDPVELAPAILVSHPDGNV